MGEYAFRKSDRVSIKIGTCESMHYLRYEDRNSVTPDAHSLNPATEMNLFWRLPFPDEDQIQPGDYRDHNRGHYLAKKETDHLGHDYYTDFADETVVEHPGLIQLKHESGLLVNVPCYHGVKLPEIGGGARAFWNGKSHHLELAHLKNMADGVWPIVKCKHCGKMWRYNWSEILPYINGAIRERLKVYATSPAA